MTAHGGGMQPLWPLTHLSSVAEGNDGVMCFCMLCPYSEPEPALPSNTEVVQEWLDEHREILNWTKKSETLVQQDVLPSWDKQTTKEQYDIIEKLLKDISDYDTKVTLLLKKGDDIVNNPITVPEDRRRIDEEIKSLKDRWNRLKVDGYNVERR